MGELGNVVSDVNGSRGDDGTLQFAKKKKRDDMEVRVVKSGESLLHGKLKHVKAFNHSHPRRT